MKSIHWSAIGAWTAGWAVVTTAYWLLSKVMDEPRHLAECAALAALAIASGEWSSRVRRRRKAKRAALRAQADE
ncbi:hypothetical protein ABZZ79_37670 [Streptomyces sp. NPDC006458]|uniref:hypothetical protein n=1 Tax=Streptomyces sp. NPDC006458 TaxID=3154302 RepID=UPI0033B6EDAD